MHWPDFPPAFYAVAVIAILLTGIAKGGFGTGSGGLAVPLMSIFITPFEAAAIMLPILCAMDLFGVHAYRGRWSKEHLLALLAGALAGIVAGAVAFGTLPVNVIRFLIGAIAVAFALNQWFKVTERIAARLAARRAKPGRVAGFVWGAISGFTSTLAHAGGPPFAVYMLPQKLDKTVLVATSAIFFLAVNYVKLVPYQLLGQLSAGNLAAALLFAPLAPLGVWLGVWLHRRVSERAFYDISYTLLLATGLKLVWDSLAR
ncbi:MAG: sulfite exporter TauE/SafE family protein [Casimicrobiaceae bacterium]